MVARGHWPAQEVEGRVGAVVVAAGRSRRMGGIDKVLVPLLGCPLIAYPIRVLEKHPSVQEIVLVVARGKVAALRSVVAVWGWRKTRVCVGGRRRQDSVWAGLKRLGPCQWVLVHDGARPCLDAALIDRGLEAVGRVGAAVAAVPMSDTVKVVSSQGLVESTLPRESLWGAQTPQLFRPDLLLEAHRRCREDVTDDATMVERQGHPVAVFMGSYENVKVTTPQDLVIVEAILRNRGVSAR